MAIYAIGDVQGCFSALEQLLKTINFKPGKDRLWFVGDLVNRGPDSLSVLRFVQALGDDAVCTLGNHDLHLLARAHGMGKARRGDTLDEVLNAPDLSQLLDWLRHQPLLHIDETLGYALAHAGIYPRWTLSEAKVYAREVENLLRGADYVKFLSNMYGNAPTQWSDHLQGDDRLRFIVNAFTRMRFCDAAGALDMKEKCAPDERKEGLWPWYDWPDRVPLNSNIVFGHWSTLGLWEGANVLAIDAGCVYGGHLIAVRLTPGKTVCYRAQCTRKIDPLSLK